MNVENMSSDHYRRWNKLADEWFVLSDKARCQGKRVTAEIYERKGIDALARLCGILAGLLVLTGCATTHDADHAQPPVYLASDLTPEHAEAVAAAVQGSRDDSGCGWYVQYAQLDDVLAELRAADPCAVTVQLAPTMDAGDVARLVREARP